MKILWVSNAPHTPTGYGVPTKNILPYLQELGHEVAVQSTYGIHGASVDYGDVVIYPTQGAHYGVDVIGAHARHFGAELVITLMDNWVLPADYNERFAAPWLSWFPIDGNPIAAPALLMARKADYNAVFSRDAQMQFEDLGMEVEYVPYAVDCAVFKPGDKQAAREALGFPPDCWLAVTVAANKGYPARKSWPELLSGFQIFQERHREALLYLHTRKKPINKEGVYFGPLIATLGVQNVVFVDQNEMAVGIPNDELPLLYQAADVLLLPSMGEGFGLPIIEAQACGCPVITQDCSAMSEITYNGIAIEPLQQFWMPILNTWWQLASVERIAKALEDIYGRADADLVEYEQTLLGVQMVKVNYDWPYVVQTYWKPLLERIEEELW